MADKGREQLTREEKHVLAWAAGYMQLHATEAVSDFRYNLLDSARTKLKAEILDQNEAPGGSP